MYVRIVCLVLLVLGLGPARASCGKHELTPPEKLRIAGDRMMLVVHQSSTYDARHSTKRGVDMATRYAKNRKIPLVYLQDDTPDEFYFMADCEPDHWVFSEGGEIRFEVTTPEIYIIGGHLELCMSSALHDIILQWSKRQPRSYRLVFLMDAIYSNGKMIEPEDPYYADFERFMGIVTYGRPGGEHWPKLSLLETMGIIRREEHELEYLKKVLPRWDRTFPPAFRIVVQLNDSVQKVLRAAPGWNPPTVLFHFVDSALTLENPRPEAY